MAPTSRCTTHSTAPNGQFLRKAADLCQVMRRHHERTAPSTVEISSECRPAVGPGPPSGVPPAGQHAVDAQPTVVMKEPTTPSRALRAFIGNAKGFAQSLDGRWVLYDGLVLCAARTATQAHLPPRSSFGPCMAAMSTRGVAGTTHPPILYCHFEVMSIDLAQEFGQPCQSGGDEQPFLKG
jgi:hypothetical protein